MVELFRGDCVEILDSKSFRDILDDSGKTPIIVTDPPFNIGYHYKSYKDKLKEEDYFNWLTSVLNKTNQFVIVHYPEQLCKLSIKLGRAPDRVVSWVYNSNTARQHRDIAFFGINPDFNLVKQPYKNPNDKRIKKLIAEGKGARLYDWWNVNQVKNTSKEKAEHPCQMPQDVLDKLIGILPNKDNLLVIDPFMGTGTTGVACVKHGVDFIGIESDLEYYLDASMRIRGRL